MFPSQAKKYAILFNRLNIGNIHSAPVLCQAQFAYFHPRPVERTGPAVDAAKKPHETIFALTEKNTGPIFAIFKRFNTRSIGGSR